MWKIILKIDDFSVDNNIFSNTQNALGCTILIKKSAGEHPPYIPSTNLNPHHYRAIYVPGM